jgi:hypothetical protein
MVNTQPHKSEYHKGYHGTTLKNTSYYTTSTAPIAFFVMRCKKFKTLPERFFKDSSSKYIAKEKAYTALSLRI